MVEGIFEERRFSSWIETLFASKDRSDIFLALLNVLYNLSIEKIEMEAIIDKIAIVAIISIRVKALLTTPPSLLKSLPNLR